MKEACISFSIALFLKALTYIRQNRHCRGLTRAPLDRLNKRSHHCVHYHFYSWRCSSLVEPKVRAHNGLLYDVRQNSGLRMMTTKFAVINQGQGWKHYLIACLGARLHWLTVYILINQKWRHWECWSLLIYTVSGVAHLTDNTWSNCMFTVVISSLQQLRYFNLIDNLAWDKQLE